MLLYGFAPLQLEKQFEATIDTPLPGEAVQGLAIIRGTFSSEEFISYTLEFAFSSQSGSNWFLIASGTDLPTENILAEWDTSTITDGIYALRLTVHLPEGNSVVVMVDGVRVRNYSTIETNTPEPTSAFTVAAPTRQIENQPAPTDQIFSTPTPYAQNRASFSPADLDQALVRGSIIGLAGFLLITLIFITKRPKE